MKRQNHFWRPPSGTDGSRRANITVLAAACLILVFGFPAFAVDGGYIAMTRTQPQRATDAGALAACIKLEAGLSPTSASQSSVTSSAQTAAVAVAAANPAGNKSSVYVNPSSDVQFGTRSWNSTTGSWKETWGGSGPYNLVQGSANRGQGSGSSGDSPLPLVF